MNEDPSIPPSRDEARAALADIESSMAQTRRAIAEGSAAPILILWGVLWVIMYTLAQIWPNLPRWSWIPCNAIGFGGMWWLGARRRAPVKSPSDWRSWGFWLILGGYAYLWMRLLMPWGLLQGHLPSAYVALMNRKITTYFATIPMFGFVMFGMWVGRFFLWLGLLVTGLTLLCYRYSGDYFNLSMAITGGGALILSGVFIRKFWK